MRRWHKIALSSVAGIIIAALLAVWAAHANFQVLDPHGEVAEKQLSLIIFTLTLSLFVVVPVFGLLIFISIRYREGNTKATYRPDWDHSKIAETIWWGLPCLIIIILASVIWTSSFALDPYKPLASNKTPIEVQVVALQWRWLFIYPKEHIATINDLRFPVGTPVNFTISADAPMNSLWIPNLGGQVYAMNGMSTQLHLEADKTGKFPGSSANISGKGFAGMKFIARATTDRDYADWLRSVRKKPMLDWTAYQALAKPNESGNPTQYLLGDNELYDKIVAKYMSHGSSGMSGMSDMDEAR